MENRDRFFGISPANNFLVSSVGDLAKNEGQTTSHDKQFDAVSLLLQIASDDDIAAIHQQFAKAMQNVSHRRDPIYRPLAIEKLKSLAQECALLGEGRIEFRSTESWRLAYEELLRSPGLFDYRSVAHVETPHYWQDGPGQQSTQLNLEIQDAGLINIERTVIVANHLWREEDHFPNEPIHVWVDQQHRHGIRLRLVREQSLEAELELIADFGIYGHRAVGLQQLDSAGRTEKFVLSFDDNELNQAEQIWDRLRVYTIPYGELLDRAH